MLRRAGVRVEIHDDHFEQDTPDEVWLPSVASRDWIALTHNKRIRYSSLETEILMAAGLRTFVLVGGGPHQKLGEGFVRSLRMVHRFLDRHIGPFIAKVYCNSGKVEMWLSNHNGSRDTAGAPRGDDFSPGVAREPYITLVGSTSITNAVAGQFSSTANRRARATTSATTLRFLPLRMN